jgi:[CysO sulfur-carrier protein]-S-L-cysteine hydrolase
VVADHLVLTSALADELLAHARAEQPNEACGLLAGDLRSGIASRYLPARNAEASPLRYTVHPDDLVRIVFAIEDAGEDLVGIFHSHTHTPAVPSPTDIGLAFYPDALYVLVSLSDDEADLATGTPSVRAWRIVDGHVHEVAIDVIEG